MDQRIVKPVFWLIAILSSIALSVMTFFVIGGMISNPRGEDYFIAAVVGFILFLVARTVQGNAIELPKVAIFLMFFVILLAVVLIIMMNYALVNNPTHVNFAAFTGHGLHGGLAYMPRGVRWLGHYRSWASSLTDAGFTLTGMYVALHRALFLSYGIISGAVFIVLQCVTCALLFIGTMPQKREFRH